MRKSSHSPFPTKTQELLLQAALLKGQPMQKAWEKWKAEVNFEKEVEYASFRMLPLLYQNLQSHRMNDPLMLRLKGIYRKSWSNNHLLFHQTAKVLKLLHSHKIPTIVMKGIAMTITVYKNYGVRPMADMDILIPLSESLKTIDVLEKSGWNLQNKEHLEFNLKYGRSATFTDAAKTELDLHWHPVFEAHNSISDDEFWEASVPLEVAGENTRAFCVTDNFFHTIVHGLRYNPEPPIRWVADAVTILNSEVCSIDWDRLLYLTKKFRSSLQMKDALNYLTKNFQSVVSRSFLDELAKIKSTFSDRLVFRHAKKYGDEVPQTVYEKLYSVYAAYLRQSDLRGFWAQQIGFVKYMRFRNRGKPYFRIMLYYFSLLFRKPKKITGIKSGF
ncbi:MAG: nucleotidyltransferase family protein [Bacteroidales bacterium]|nr:nucleotidyltransferase family protein [Bacteroidales bacterium]MCF6341564.1 nucleotidyltransferase family protein [Bacteroidales bacterium]